MAVDEISRTLGNLEAKLDILLERASENDKRVRALEKDVSSVKGQAGLIAGAVTLAGTLAAAYLPGIFKS